MATIEREKTGERAALPDMRNERGQPAKRRTIAVEKPQRPALRAR
jgi:hypothetical protein